MGSFFGGIGYLFNLIFTDPMLNILMLLYRLFGDFGLSVVVLTLILRLILFPLTLQQLKSMKANQALQPHMQEIKRKYAKDQQAQMLAIQALYKEYNVKPLAGCLPLLIQMPVLYGLYYAFNNVITYTGGHVDKLNALLYPFVQNITQFTKFPNLDFAWFSWLSFLNPILHVNWSWTISLAHPDPSHVLPVIAALATFVQLRMSQPKTAPATNGKSAQPDPTQQTMKMMQYIMPIFTLVIGLSFAAGLALYWTVSSIFQAVQQYFVTGWGSLITAPNLTSKHTGKTLTVPATTSTTSTKTTATTQKREQAGNREVIPDDADEDEVIGDQEASERNEKQSERPGPIASNLRTTPAPRPRPGGNGTYPQSSNRSRNNSASARRRGGSGSTQRSRR